MKRILCFLFSLVAAVFPAAAAGTPSPVKKVVAITEIFGDGQQVTAVALQYGEKMDGSVLSPDAFAVKELVPTAYRGGRGSSGDYLTEERTVSRVYTNSEPGKAASGQPGDWVIVELEQVYHYLAAMGNPGGRGPSRDKERPSGSGGQGGFKGPGGPGGPGAGPGGNRGGRGGFGNAALPGKEGIIANYKGITRIPDFGAEVAQIKDVPTAAGRTATAFEAVRSDSVVNLILDDFVQKEYADAETGISMAYNLFIPKDYDPAKKYPLVLFMPDATICGRETTRTLTQGIGATVWASPGEQAKHPCFVLAPDYTTMIINDMWETNEYLPATVNLIGALKETYSIDADRVYTTGQSGGCMLSFAIEHYYPDLMAASLLIAGKWDSSRVDNFVGKKMWMMCGDGDAGALPSMTSVVEALREKGEKVSVAQWNGRVGAEEFDRLCADLDREGNGIRFVHFDQYSVFPDDSHLDGMEHLQTWRLTYAIEGARDWLFRQSREGRKPSSPKRPQAPVARTESAPANPVSSGHIQSVSGIAKVYSDGMKLTAAAIRYDKPLDVRSVTAESFTAQYDHPVVKAYVSSEAAVSGSPSEGPYVILEFDTTYRIPVNDQIADRGMGGPGGNRGPGGPGPLAGQPAGQVGTNLAAAIAFRGNPPAHPSISLSSRHGGTGYDIAVKQVAPIRAADGEILEGDGVWVDNEKNMTLVLDGFSKPDFTDKETGKTIKFNVFVPYDYDPAKKYPLVLYLTDEYSCENRHDAVLEKGKGPSIWATPEVQARCECFVLVPVTPKTFHTAASLEETNIPTVLNLVDKLCGMYSVDADRLYLVGQSQAGAECLALMERYPGRFAAALCLSGAWTKASSYLPFRDAAIMLVASEGDTSGREMVEAFIAEAGKAGARVSEMAVKAGSASAGRKVRRLSAAKGNIKYLKFKSGSVVPDDVEDTVANEKGYTWRQAYEIDAVVDWLLSQNR